MLRSQVLQRLVSCRSQWRRSVRLRSTKKTESEDGEESSWSSDFIYPGETPSHLPRRGRKDPARDNNFSFDLWEKHRSTWRHFRHVFQTPLSATFQRVMWPDIAWVTALSASLSYYNAFIVPTSPLCISHIPLTITGTALGLLLVFRVNNSNARFDAARNTIGSIINTCRAIARISITKLELQDPDFCSEMMCLVRAFPRVLIFHLTVDGDLGISSWYSRVSPEEAEEELVRRLKKTLGDDKAAYILQARNRPLRVVQMMSIVGTNANLDPVISNRLDREIRALEQALGRCERILRTPIPTSYTRHTSRFLSVWVSTIPFAFWPVFGFYGTAPASIVTAFFMLAIEDIAVVFEEPFDVMPLWRYCETIDDSCNHAEALLQDSRRIDDAGCPRNAWKTLGPVPKKE